MLSMMMMSVCLQHMQTSLSSMELYLFQPTTNPKRTNEALDTIQEAFPDREIIGIDSRTIIRQHGSIHCLTMQLPANG